MVPTTSGQLFVVERDRNRTGVAGRGSHHHLVLRLANVLQELGRQCGELQVGRLALDLAIAVGAFSRGRSSRISRESVTCVASMPCFLQRPGQFVLREDTPARISFRI